MLTAAYPSASAVLMLGSFAPLSPSASLVFMPMPRSALLSMSTIFVLVLRSVVHPSTSSVSVPYLSCRLFGLCCLYLVCLWLFLGH